MTPLASALTRLYKTSGHTSLRDWSIALGAPYETLRRWMHDDVEPRWLRVLRTIKRRTGVSWAELLDGHAWERKAVKMSKPDRRTDCATGHHECSACGCHVSPVARFCEGCGAYFINCETEDE